MRNGREKMEEWPGKGEKGNLAPRLFLKVGACGLDRWGHPAHGLQ